MSKFTFINEQFDYDEYTGEQRNLVSKTTREFHGHTLDGVLDEMTAFLRGAGYYFDGHLDVVSYESEIDKIDDELDDLKDEIRSKKVFDHIVSDLSTNPIQMDHHATFTISGANDFSDSQYSFNFDTMAGAQPVYNVNISDEGDFVLKDLDLSSSIPIETIDISSLMSQDIYSIDSSQIPSLSIENINLDLNEYCEICKFPKSVMQLHNCYDAKCPIKVTQ